MHTPSKPAGSGMSESQELALFVEYSSDLPAQPSGNDADCERKQLKQGECSPNAGEPNKGVSEEIFQRFKVPLIAIMNMADLIKQTDMTNEQKVFIQTIEESAESVLTEVNKVIEKAQSARFRARPGIASDADSLQTKQGVLPEPAMQPHISAQAVANWYHSATKSSLRVLVVEDNPVLQLAILKQLFHLGIQADAVSDGESAVKAADEKKFDLIFMDCQLPILDGFKATKTIRDKQTDDGTKIVALTAGYEQSVREKCLSSGMDECLIKPARIDDLRHVIERWYRLS